MATHQLVVSKDINAYYPVRPEAGQFQVVTTLVVHWKGSWALHDRPELYLVVAPGDELELAPASAMEPGGSVWLFKRGAPVLLPSDEIARQDAWERVDVDGESAFLHLNPAIAQESGEIRYELRISELAQKPLPLVGNGLGRSPRANRP